VPTTYVFMRYNFNNAESAISYHEFKERKNRKVCPSGESNTCVTFTLDTLLYSAFIYCALNVRK